MENQSSRGRGHNKKKPNISRQQTTSMSMRTRSGGQPTHSYAHIAFEIKDEKIENSTAQQKGKRGRANNKGNGKGGSRGRKTGGR